MSKGCPTRTPAAPAQKREVVRLNIGQYIVFTRAVNLWVDCESIHRSQVISDRFFISDTNYLYVYVPDNRYAEPIFIYCYKVNQ